MDAPFIQSMPYTHIRTWLPTDEDSSRRTGMGRRVLCSLARMAFAGVGGGWEGWVGGTLLLSLKWMGSAVGWGGRGGEVKPTTCHKSNAAKEPGT